MKMTDFCKAQGCTVVINKSSFSIPCWRGGDNLLFGWRTSVVRRFYEVCPNTAKLTLLYKLGKI